LRTDGGLQFTSREAKEFFMRWGITHVVSSPHYPQSNGHAESAVKATKAIIKKTSPKTQTCEQFAQAMLELRNTPRADGRSPAQVVFGRSIRSNVPAHHHAYAQVWWDLAREADIKAANRQEEAKERYDKSARNLRPLNVGDSVRIQNSRNKRWDRIGVIVEVGKFRTYKVKLPSGKVWTRNRRFLRLRRTGPEIDSPEKVNSSQPAENTISTQRTGPASTSAREDQPMATRCSTRQRKKTVRFDL
jgi:hypothetical protein